jgi:DNA-binding response OmpR family regulator
MKQLNLIYAEDDNLTAKVMIFALKKEGFAIRYFPSGEGVVEAALEDKPDIILLDLMMPIKDGYKVYREIKENKNTSDVPVLMFSAVEQMRDIETNKKFKQDEYIVKPCSPEYVIDKIKSLLNYNN